MIKVSVVNVKTKTNKASSKWRRWEWGFILAILAVSSVFLGSTVLKLDLSFFQLYPLRLFGFIGVSFMFLNEKWRDPFLSFCFKFTVFFLVFALFSILWAPDTGLAIKEFGIIQTGLTLSWLVYKYINTEKRIELVLKIWLIGAIFINMIGLWEVWHQQYLIVTNVGENTANAIIKMGFMAPRSIFANQNNYAFFNALTALVLLGNLIKRYRPSILYILNIFGFILSLFLLITSYSRAAIAGFALGAFLFFIFTFISENYHKKRLFKFVLIGFVLLVVLVNINDALMDSLSKMLKLVIEKNEQKDEEGRAVLYSESIYYAAYNFGIGMGPGSSVTRLAGLPPHNYLIQILVEYGVTILLWQLWIFYKVYNRLGLYSKAVYNAMPVMLKCSIIVFPLLCVGPSTILGEGVFWLWFGLIIAYSSVLIRKHYARILNSSS